jgi:translation initiation factor 3 subunit I
MRPFHVRGTERAVLVVKLNYDGDLFFQGSQDGCERLGSYKTSAAIKTLDITDDSKILVTGSLEGSVDFFEVTGALIGSLKAPGRKAKHVELSFGDKMLIIVQSNDHRRLTNP